MPKLLVTYTSQIVIVDMKCCHMKYWKRLIVIFDIHYQELNMFSHSKTPHIGHLNLNIQSYYVIQLKALNEWDKFESSMVHLTQLAQVS